MMMFNGYENECVLLCGHYLYLRCVWLCMRMSRFSVCVNVGVFISVYIYAKMSMQNCYNNNVICRLCSLICNTTIYSYVILLQMANKQLLLLLLLGLMPLGLFCCVLLRDQRISTVTCLFPWQVPFVYQVF